MLGGENNSSNANLLFLGRKGKFEIDLFRIRALWDKGQLHPTREREIRPQEAYAVPTYTGTMCNMQN